MNKGKAKSKMSIAVIFVVFALAVVSFIAWYIYTTSYYEIDVEFIGKIETEMNLTKNDWCCITVETAIRELSQGGAQRAVQNSNTEEMVEKLKLIERDKYNILITDGSRIEKVTKTREEHDRLLKIDYSPEFSHNSLYLYTIDKNVRPVNDP
jgi:cell division protein YceG involved in septum cleavage